MGFFDKADVTITMPATAIMEDDFECEIKVFPKSDAKLRKIEIAFVCQETAISRGTTDHYYRTDVYSDIRIPQKDIQIRKDYDLVFTEKFKFPPFTTPTIYEHNHRVEWLVRVRLDVPWWPDTRHSQAIRVLPFLVAPELF